MGADNTYSEENFNPEKIKGHKASEFNGEYYVCPFTNIIYTKPIVKKHNMTLNEYQEFTDTTAIYPKVTAIEYCTLGLVGEAGEVANKVKKIIRDGHDWSTETRLEKQKEVAKELGDCYWYLARLASELGYNSQDLLELNVAKLTARKEKGTISGDGDNR